MSDIKGLKPVMPAGAMYMMVSNVSVSASRLRTAYAETYTH